ncbi:hypothetical protein MMC25_003394 [Agyrium rufum]|nr:hypothetical protein [Agyrium rufum]
MDHLLHLYPGPCSTDSSKKRKIEVLDPDTPPSSAGADAPSHIHYNDNNNSGNAPPTVKRLKQSDYESWKAAALSHNLSPISPETPQHPADIIATRSDSFSSYRPTFAHTKNSISISSIDTTLTDVSAISTESWDFAPRQMRSCSNSSSSSSSSATEVAGALRANLLSEVESPSDEETSSSSSSSSSSDSGSGLSTSSRSRRGWTAQPERLASGSSGSDSESSESRTSERSGLSIVQKRSSDASSSTFGTNSPDQVIFLDDSSSPLAGRTMLDVRAPASLKSRLESFLPALRDSNQELEEQPLEASDEITSKAHDVQAADRDGSGSSDGDVEDNGGVLAKLMPGRRKNNRGQRGVIEVLEAKTTVPNVYSDSE